MASTNASYVLFPDNLNLYLREIVELLHTLNTNVLELQTQVNQLIDGRSEDVVQPRVTARRSSEALEDSGLADVDHSQSVQALKLVGENIGEDPTLLFDSLDANRADPDALREDAAMELQSTHGAFDSFARSFESGAQLSQKMCQEQKAEQATTKSEDQGTSSRSSHKNRNTCVTCKSSTTPLPEPTTRLFECCNCFHLSCKTHVFWCSRRPCDYTLCTDCQAKGGLALVQKGKAWLCANHVRCS